MTDAKFEQAGDENEHCEVCEMRQADCTCDWKAPRAAFERAVDGEG